MLMRNFTKVFVSLLLLCGAMNVSAKTESVDVVQYKISLAEAEVTPAVANWVASEHYSETTEMGTEALDAKINAVFSKGTGSNAPKYYTNGTAVRAYGGNTFTISGDKVAIQKIEITFGTGDGSNELTADKGTMADGVWTPADGDANTNNVKFTVGGTTGNRRIAALKVTYVDDENATVVVVEEKHIANTLETAYTVAQAVELIDAGEALDETVFVKGIVSKVDKFDETDKYITYWISEDGKTSGQQFELYHGKGLEGADFASIDDIELRASVIVTGKLSKFGDTYEMGAGNALASYTAPVKSDLMKEAETLAADEEAVAVGKLIDAIAAAKASGDETELATAVAQFKTDNADQEADQTAKVNTTGWKKFDGSGAGVCATQFAPAITTYDGRTANLAESYEEGTAEGTAVNRLGTIIYQDITGLTNGTYKVGFYGNAFFTAGRAGMTSPMTDGDEDVAYVFANDQKAFIAAHIATSTTENNFSQFDVEVTDGTIKLGMGKEKPGTNWHTMQIYQLTWFTTAKAVYAADKADMEAAIASAKALQTADRVNGTEEFATAIADAEAALASNKLNLTEFEAAIAALKKATTTFRAANYVTFEGIAYVKDAETGKFMAAGHDWGTRAIVNEEGLDLTFAIADGKVTIDTRIKNGDNDHFLGDNLYMDAPAFSWNLEKAGEGYYITNGSQFVSVDANDNLVKSDTPRQWLFVSVEEVEAAKLATLANATQEVGVDATFLIKAANFNRNDARNAENWVVSEDCGNKNLSGGNNTNNCAESYHSTFTISQALKNAPKGIYKMTAQGFYRQDQNSSNVDSVETVPVFFIGDVTAEVPAKTGSETNMSMASESFSADRYTIDTITYAYNGEGDLVVGIKNETAHYQWIIFDNFRLTYFAAPLDKSALETAITDAKTAVEALTSENAKAYLNAAITAAEAVVAEAKTQDELDAAVTALNDKVAIAKEADAYKFDRYAQYAWESPKGVMCEKGGKITYENGDGNRLNYQQAGYYTICLNGKKANMNDETASANAGYMLVTLDEPVQAGDVIRMSAFLNKNASKTASAWFVFENNATLAGEVYGDEANIYSGEDVTFNGAVTTKDVVVPAEAAGSKTIKITRNTAGTNLFVTKFEILRLPVDITLNVESGKDIATELAAAVDGKDVASITINLAEGGEYTVSGSLKSSTSFTLNGNGATIDASELAGAFINYESVIGEKAKKDDGTDSKYTIVENVTIQGVKIAGLSQSLINNGAGNVLFNKVLVDNSVVEIKGSNSIFALGQGYPEDLKITNSTLWSKEGHTGFLFQAHGKAIDIKADNKTSWTVDKSTLYQIAKGKKANNTNTFRGKPYLVITLTNSLLYDFGSSTGNEVNGWLFGQNSTSPVITYANNAYLNAEGVVSGWTDETKGGSDQTGTSIAAVVTFADAAAGNFNATLALAEGAVAPETVGDPRWTITVGGGDEIADGIYDLTQEMFKTWASHEATEGTTIGCAFAVETATQMVYGDSNVGWLNYADLSGYDKLVVIATSGAPRFCFNRTVDNAQDNDDPATSQFIDIPGHSWGTEAYETVDENNQRFIIDLKKMTQERGFAHLHAIKGANWSDVVVVAMKLVKGDVELPSGIENLAAVAAQKDGKFFVNGKLVIVRNGQQFNAKGQLVK